MDPTADLTLERFAYTPMGTFGRMVVGETTLYTVERPWLGNRRRMSCIPEGTYRCAPRHFHRGGYPAVEVTGVPGRDHILFHRGNTMFDVTGCIAVTTSLGCLPAPGGSELVWAGIDAAGAWKVFFPRYGNREFTLALTRFTPDDRCAVVPSPTNEEE